ncbi:MAG TPA: ABC transporter permease [Vicinamibacterales bacterium]|nr:ABC transporter permease [Vicinamibacterales bacterium]
MNWLSQTLAVTAVTIRSIPQRLGSSIVAIIGIGGVVVVFTAVLSIAEGFRAAMQGTGDPQTVIVLRSGSDTEMTSGFGGEEARLISEAPGLEHGPDGPHASPELFVIVGHPLKRSGTDANVPLRGVTLNALKVRPQLRIVEGRMFQPGTNEIVVGRAASRQFSGLSVGANVRWGDSSWQVVGVFDAGGSVAESELWCDAKVLQPAYRRGNSYQSVYARLESVDSFQKYKDALTTDPRLNVTVVREPDYYSQQSQVLQTVIRSIGFGIATLMGLGAIFGALNTMYSAVANRTREIATLRALGFGASPVVISVLFEAVLLSVVGGLIGGGLAWAGFDGYQTTTMNWQSFSQVAFAFDVSPGLLFRGMFYAVIMGLLGGLFPAIRAARMPVVTALRQL